MAESKRPDTSPRQRGVTLIEQIMVLLIIGTLASVALPSLSKLLSTNQLRVAQSDFLTGLQHARAAAVMSGRPTVFCPSADGARCSNDTRWDRGWLLGHDANRDNQPDAGPLYTGSAYRHQLTIHSSNGRRFTRFQPDGSAGGSNLTLVFCQPSGTEPALSIVVSNAGRVRGAPASAEQATACRKMR